MMKVTLISALTILAGKNAFSQVLKPKPYQPPAFTHVIVCSEKNSRENSTAYRKLSAYIPAETGKDREPTFSFSIVDQDPNADIGLVDEIQETAKMQNFKLSITSNEKGESVVDALTINLGRAGETEIVRENNLYYAVSTARHFLFPKRSEVLCSYFFQVGHRPSFSGSN